MVNIQLAKPVQKKLKVLLYGASGSGKTIAALSFPRVLLVDGEAGSELYRGRPNIPEFHVADCKTLSDLDEVIRAFEADKGKTWDTLVIDPISVFYAVEKNIASKNSTADIDMRGWNKINGRMNNIYTRLTSLNGHVVIIARESTEYAGEGLNLKKIGVKPDADKNLVYAMDFVIHMNANHSGQVEKSRGMEIGKDGLLSVVSWDVFKPIAEPFKVGESVTHESDEDAANREIDSLSNEDVRREFFNVWVKQGLTQADIFIALGNITRLGEWPHGRIKADEAIKAWHEKQLSGKPATPKNEASVNASH